MKTNSRVILFATGLLMSSFAMADHHKGGMHDDMHGDHMPPMFEQFDKDHDGRISREEAREGADKMFTDIDTNKDGFISKEEMQAHHKAMREKMHESMNERWKAADKDGDGALTKAEVDAAKMTRLSRDFDKLDKNKDGKLTQEEVRAGMMQDKPAH